MSMQIENHHFTSNEGGKSGDEDINSVNHQMMQQSNMKQSLMTQVRKMVLKMTFSIWKMKTKGLMMSSNGRMTEMFF